ncbi:MAG: hypothetical protein ACRC3Y_10690 [Romboutsia sp.]|uniref:hypothetical protein n=1 Tax=Romboutsia sp. TaxID=1965302 RepID=UPI003F327D59
MYYMDISKAIEELGENYYYLLNQNKKYKDQLKDIYIALKRLGLEDQVNQEIEKIEIELSEVPF